MNFYFEAQVPELFILRFDAHDALTRCDGLERKFDGTPGFK